MEENSGTIILGEYFWWIRTREETPSERMSHHFHQVRKIGYEETPAGTDGELYTAVCGEQLTNYYYADGGIVHCLGNLEEAVASGLSLCPKCFEENGK